MTALAPLHFGSHDVRHQDVDGVRWLVVRDCGACLDMSRSATRMAHVTVAGALDMALDSRKPEAKAYRRWLTHEVAVAVLTTGRYEVAPMDNAELMSRALVLAHETLAKVEQRALVAEVTVEDQAAEIVVMQPAYEVSQVRCRGQSHESTTSAWRAAMGRLPLTAVWRQRMKTRLWKETERGWAWRSRYLDLGWGCDVESVYGGIVTDEVRWFEKGRLALPLWVQAQERQSLLPTFPRKRRCSAPPE